MLRFNISTVDNAPSYRPVLPPATTRWVGVVTAAGLTRFVGIGGRSCFHFFPNRLEDKERRVLVAVTTTIPSYSSQFVINHCNTEVSHIHMVLV